MTTRQLRLVLSVIGLAGAIILVYLGWWLPRRSRRAGWEGWTDEKDHGLHLEVHGSEIVVTLPHTHFGPQAHFKVTWEAEDEDRVLTKSDQRLFGTEVEAIAWLDSEATRRGFASILWCGNEG